MSFGLLYSALYVMSWLVPLLLILLCIWIVSKGNRESTKDIVTNKSLFPDMPKVRPRGEITIWIGSMMAMLAIGLALGYGTRDHELNSNTRMYWGVSVLSQQSDRRYTVHIPDYEKNWDWEFCHSIKMPGQLIDIKYEQRFGCKAVNGVGFVSIHQEEHNAAIQTGRNSTATTATAERLEAGR